MKTILTGVLALLGVYGLFLLIQQILWFMISIQTNIPCIIGALLGGYCFRKFLIYKKAVKNDIRFN